jgi:hypothetical protein
MQPRETSDMRGARSIETFVKAMAKRQSIWPSDTARAIYHKRPERIRTTRMIRMMPMMPMPP